MRMQASASLGILNFDRRHRKQLQLTVFAEQWVIPQLSRKINLAYGL